ncbi:MAG: hypothetical protein ACR2IV_11705 [Bryobacteraceae bacterium]
MTLILRIIAALVTIGGTGFGIDELTDPATRGVGFMAILGSLGFGAFQWVIADMADRLESIDKRIEMRRGSDPR